MTNKINYTKIQNCLETKGYFVLKNFLPKSLCKKLLDKILEKKIVKKDPANFHQGGKMIYNLQNKDRDFLNLIFDEKFNKISKNYFKPGAYSLDKDIYQFELLYSRILTGKCKSQNLHIDSRVCGINPPTHIHFFIYLSDVNEMDGPTQLVPKSHKILRYPKKKDKTKALKITGGKGTVIVINSSIWHGSSVKKSIKPRVILTLSYSRWHLRQPYAVPYAIPDKFEKKLTIKQKKLLGYFNYPPKNEKFRLRMRGPLTTLKVK